ncbi:MAG: family 43 glycosylhydrolase [Bacteroidales bacterium]|nr:family 43 glycosylhydrolase [Bacteroidales bacterium]
MFAAAALLLAACGGPADRTPNGTFVNPILGGDYPDPSIVRDGSDYYMTHSSFDYNPGLVVWHSTDLVHWEPVSYALQTYLGSVWAPDISRIGDRFYIYFTVHGRGNWVVYADTPYGPWSEPHDLHVGQIDPCPAVAEDGSKWLFLSGGMRVRLTDDGLDTVPGTLEKVYAGWPIPEDWVTEGLALEGPKIRKVGPWWYFIAAEGGTAGPPTSHLVAVARSKSVDGPWENSPYNPLVHTYHNTDRWWSRGHGSLIDTPDGRWYIVYHAYENGYYNLGRQTLLEPVWLDDQGWWRSYGENIVEDPIAAPLPQQTVPERHTRLGEWRIGLDWKYYKDFDPARAIVQDGTLTLKATGTCPADAAPMLFVAGDHAYEFEVEIDRDPSATAGLVVYYNSQYYIGEGFNGAGTLRWRRDRGGRRQRIEDVTHVWLRLRNDHQIITAYYSLDGREWHKDDWGIEISGYNHNTFHEFQSMLPGLVAAGEGEVRFSNFKYRTLQ